jgi:hypothetical protein
MTAAKNKGIDPELQKAISKMLKDTMANKEATLTDKCKVIDRALKFEQLKQRLSDDGFGSGFFQDEE